MTEATANRRRDARHEFSTAAAAWVEFDDPKEQRRRLPLLDLSVAGLAFTVPRWMHTVDAGCQLDRAVIRVGDARVEGRILVLHVTGRGEADSVCGALFYPGSDADANRLGSLISGFEAARV